MSLSLLAAVGCEQRPPPSPFDPRDEGIESALAGCDASVASTSAPEVLINEVFAGNLFDETEDWIELHNAGSHAISLDGWVLEDLYTGDMSKEAPGRYAFPTNTSICAGGYLLIERGDGCAERLDVFDFGIGSTDKLVLTAPSGRVADDIEWLDLPPTQAFGRIGASSSDLGRLASPTPGYSNADACECCGECELGRCTLDQGACVAETEADCQSSLACAQLGWCALQNGQCAATDDTHCQQALVCARSGKCGAHDGACEVVDSEGCRASRACENEGRCAKDPDAPLCIAVSETDCQASDDCLNVDPDTGDIRSKKNRCVLQGTRCVATGCEDTTQCFEKMCCDLVDGRCVRL